MTFVVEYVQSGSFQFLKRHWKIQCHSKKKTRKGEGEEEEEEEENAILLVYYCYVTSYYYLYYAILFICICFWAASVAMHIFFDRDACEYSPFPDGPTHW